MLFSSDLSWSSLILLLAPAANVTLSIPQTKLAHWKLRPQWLGRALAPTHLLVVLHHLSFGQADAGQLVPLPLHRSVQELFHLPLGQDVGVPQQLIFVLVDCGGRQGMSGMSSAVRQHRCSPRLVCRGASQRENPSLGC